MKRCYLANKDQLCIDTKPKITLLLNGVLEGQMLATPLGLIDLTPESLSTIVGSARLSVVLVEPTLALLSDPRYVMLNESYRVIPITSLFELSLLSVSEAFSLAIVSDTLGSAGLADATRLLRRQWPSARILVLGHASFVLEDHLYDDSVPHAGGEQDLCDTLSRLSTQRTLGRPFIVTMPASESLKHRNATSAEQPENAPERMTQMRVGL